MQLQAAVLTETFIPIFTATYEIFKLTPLFNVQSALCKRQISLDECYRVHILFCCYLLQNKNKALLAKCFISTVMQAISTTT